jgi:pyruvate dehydrogenase E1 component
VDGDYQLYSVAPGSFIRQHFFGKYGPKLLSLVENLTDRQLERLNRGGHDARKVYAAYKAATEHRGGPTVILAKTVKGYGLGEAGEGRNVSHKQKKLNEGELDEFRARFGIPIDEKLLHETPFFRPEADSKALQYLNTQRQALGGPFPVRRVEAAPLKVPQLEAFYELMQGTGEREMATTMAFVRLLRRLLRDKELGPRVVPIVPDEARTFGMDALFREHGIYSSVGQGYEPVDRETLLYYREARDGQILEEGITEAGSTASFIAAGTAYANHRLQMIPFFIFYSIFGFQRVGDLLWAAADARARGFLLGATAGRTTLAGEGLQHQDGHSHVLASTVPNIIAYDPAYAYEVAVIIQEGMRRMGENGEDLLYYITLYNEVYPMPAMPEDSREGILRGIYRLAGAPLGPTEARAELQLLASGPMVREALQAQRLLAENYGVAAQLWNVTSYKELRRDALETERYNRLHPLESPRQPYLRQALQGVDGPFLAVSDYMKLVPEQIARWLPGRMEVLGTDGFGRSDTRRALRQHFEVSAEHIAYSALYALVEEGTLERNILVPAMEQLQINPEHLDPVKA